MKKLLLLFGLLCFGITSSAQIDWNTEEEDAQQETQEIPLSHLGMSYAINIGIYLANDVTANYYNGDPNGANSIMWLYTNPNTYAEIRDEFNGNNWTFADLSESMRYDTPMMFGVNLQYFWREDLGVFLDFNTAQLISGGYVTLQVDQASGGATQENFVLAEIWGEESRVHVNLGLTYVLKNETPIQPFISGGIDFLYTEVETNKVKIESRTYTILNNGINGQVNLNQGGMGVGWMVAPGLKFRLNASFSADIGWNLYNTQVRVGDYTERNWNSAPFLRLVYYDF